MKLNHYAMALFTKQGENKENLAKAVETMTGVKVESEEKQKGLFDLYQEIKKDVKESQN